MSTKRPSVEYLSAGANRQTAVADWGDAGLLAFGADSNIAVWEPRQSTCRGVKRLLSGHKDTVKAVTFLPAAQGDTSAYLVSGSDDKTLIVWRAEVGSSGFVLVQTSAEHTGAINCITALRVTSSPKWILATGSADATINVWQFEDNNLQLLQSIKTTPKFFPLALSLDFLDQDGGVLVLAAAGTKDIIQLHLANITGNNIDFQLQATLKGHEGWIRSLSFTRESKNLGADLLLASASQDKYVRIWRVHEGQNLPAMASSDADPSNGAYLPGKSPSNKAYWLKSGTQDFSVTFEALLLGHEDWIYSARWCAHEDAKLQLLSTSADNSLAIWEADPSSGIWVSTVRLGEISREKGATTATGSTGGFWTGLWSPDGKSVACLGRTGSWRRWEYEESTDAWRPCVAISGHTKAVTGISWSRNGEFLLSTSSDQTTRLHTQWAAAPGANTWHEMSRPQIHGYDLNCIDSFGASQFVSGADEKLMRVFSEPKAVAGMLNRLASIGDGSDVDNMPDAANMPVLGLSNKAIDAADEDLEIQPADDRDRDAMDPASVVKKSYLEIDHPPFDETLSRHTLWPETEKLYGHGYEISCLAASHDGTLVASACKASSTNHAVIRLFETQRWTEVKPPLTAHSLTATRLRFSEDDRYLLSVGRDRQWAVFERSADDPQQFQPLQSNPKGHSRMILDAAWAPGRQTPVFATAGRDKQVRVWATTQDTSSSTATYAQAAALTCATPATAVDFLQVPVGSDGLHVLAVGTEAGRLSLCLVKRDGSEAKEIPLPAEFCLPKTILQLSWRPRLSGPTSGAHELAVAGDDGSLRVFAFDDIFFNEAHGG